MLSCKEITELATQYLEGDLPWGKRLRVRVHLSMCQHCRRYLDQMRKVAAMLRRLPAEPPSPDVLDTLTLRFRQELGKAA
jgi:predicted anti-sigma-YlaC factor YlaD